MNSCIVAPRTLAAASIAHRVAPLPALPRRVRLMSALASAVLSAVLLGSVVLGLTGNADRAPPNAWACAAVAPIG